MESIFLLIKNRFLKPASSQKQRFIITCTIVFAAVLSISVLISMRRSDSAEIPAGPQRLSINSPVPAEDLYLPDEPDFIPGVILDREQRSHWTEQDVSEFWQDPLRSGEEAWREKVETVIDKILERIP